MPGLETIAVVSEWVGKAENDLKTAAIVLKAAKDCPTDTACFHAQQVVEKYLKALLALHGLAFPKTHDLRQLIAKLPANVPVNLPEDAQDQLTDYATAARYPGFGDISLADARKAVAIARRVRREIRKLLPKQALRRTGHGGAKSRRS